MRYKVVLTDHAFPEESLVDEVLAQLGVPLEVHARLDEEDLTGAVRDADVVMIEYAKLDRRIIAAMERARVIVRHGVGYDSVDLAAATEAGICVCNVTDYCTPEVADHTMSMLLALARSLLPLDSQVRQGGWDVFAAAGRNRRLEGQTLGLVGFGKIGQAVGRRAAAFGMKLAAFDPFLPAEAVAAAGATKMEMEELLGVADFVSMHVPLSPRTRHTLNAERIALMKPTAFVLNTSRGGTVDMRALAGALAEGRLAGAGLDVFEQEPPARDDPLLRLPNVILSAHCAFYSVESLLELHARMVRQAAAVLQGRRPANLVNPEVLQKLSLSD